MAHRITLYDTLGVQRDASEQEIRSAFRRLSMDHHPDRFSGEKRGAAEQRFQAITEAFNVLSNTLLVAEQEVDKPVDISLMGMLRQLRDPAVRRGLVLTMRVMHIVGSQASGNGNGSKN